MGDGYNGSTRIEALVRDFYSYVNLRFAALKLNLVESLSELFSNIIAILIFGVFALLALMLFTVALVVWLGMVLGSFITATLIVGGFFLLVAIVVLLLRNRIMTNTMVRMFSRMVFQPKIDDNEQ